MITQEVVSLKSKQDLMLWSEMQQQMLAFTLQWEDVVDEAHERKMPGILA